MFVMGLHIVILALLYIDCYVYESYYFNDLLAYSFIII